LTLKKQNKIFYLIFIIALSLHAECQEKGMPFFHNYSSKAYKSATQNWCIAQGPRGLIYVGNDEGILQYDGTFWRKIQITNLSTIRSLAVDSNGVVYVGAHNEFGFLKPDKTGKLIYQSLMPLLDSAFTEFMEIWSTNTNKYGAYFVTEKYIFHFQNGKLNIIQTKGDYFFLSYPVNKELYVCEIGVGLEKIVGDSLVLTNGGEIMKQVGAFSILPYEKNKLFIGTQGNGLITYDPDTLTSPNNAIAHYKLVRTFASDFLKEFQIYHGTKIDNNKFAFATTRKGIITIDQQGNPLEYLNRNNILKEEAVYNLHHSQAQPLWMALDNGIAKAELNSPIRYWDESSGFKGTILDIIRFNGKIHIATVHGVYVLNESEKKYDINRFTYIKGLISQTWNFLDFSYENKHYLLVGSDDGIYQIKNDSAIRISDFTGGFKLFQSSVIQNRIYVGIRNHLAVFDFEQGQFKQHFIENEELNKEIRSIEEDDDGNLWLCANYYGILKIKWENENPIITKYDTTNGLPSLKEITIKNLGHKLMFGTKNGLYVFDKDANRFYRDTIFKTTDLGSQTNVKIINKDNEGNYIFNGAYLFLKAQKNTYIEDNVSLMRIPDKNPEACYIDNNYYWIGGANGLFCYDKTIEKNYEYYNSIKVLIRKVIIGKDSAIYNGFYYDKSLDTNKYFPLNAIKVQPADFLPEIKHNIGSITFYYSWPFYEDEQSNEYSYFLEGFDKSWSNYSNETKKEYTNLSEGDYIFKVKAKNIYGQVSRITTFKFKIFPPWYRSFLAFIFYLTLLIIFISVVIKIRTRRLKQEKIKLEDIVKERTAEIINQKEEIESQAEWLQAANQNMLEQKHEILFQSERLQKTNKELEKLSIIARETNNAVSVFDKNGSLEWFNEGFTRMYGFAFSQFIAEKGNNIFELSKKAEVKDAIQKCIKSKQPVIYEFCTFTKNKKSVWAQTTITPIVDDKGNVVKLIAIDSNITKLKKAENKIKKQHDALAKANATKDTFFSIIAHDLRGPFSSFSSLTELIVDNYNDFTEEELISYLKEIRNSSNTTFNLIENLLDWARTQQGDIKYTPKLIEVNLIIDENIELLQKIANEKKIKINNLLNEKITVFADENMIKTVFRNLISNAIKFTSEGGNISINGIQIKNNWQFEIKDTGIGIAKENIPKLFRIDTHHTTLGTKQEKGTGLGLILCKDFIEKHRGKIWVESEKGKGSTFIFTIPV